MDLPFRVEGLSLVVFDTKELDILFTRLVGCAEVLAAGAGEAALVSNTTGTSLIKLMDST